jgi:hypothetical protein
MGEAGVSVDTWHWIGGRRVASPGTLTDLSPSYEQPLAEAARAAKPRRRRCRRPGCERRLGADPPQANSAYAGGIIMGRTWPARPATPP